MTAPASGPPPRSAPAGVARGLGARLLTALVVVLVAGGATAWLVAAAVGPGLFHTHMVSAGLGDHDAAVLHAERAFREASTVALAVALGAAAVASVAVSLVLTRRIGRSLAAVSAATARLAAGRYDERVPASALGAEFDELAASVNALAARLQEAERLRARLLADVAHELRTPVATLTGYLEAVEDGVRPLDASTIAVLRDQAVRLTRLAQDLADVTHAEGGDLVLDRAPVAPVDLLRAAGAAHEPVPGGPALVVDAAPGLPRVRVDRTRIAQVLDNLVANAVRHTPPEGTVTLTATRTGTGVQLSVTDTGEGIAAEDLPHVFERFYRAGTARDRTHGGAGIGLAISRALTEAHGGTLTATSAGPGAGATFTVTLPVD